MIRLINRHLFLLLIFVLALVILSFVSFTHKVMVDVQTNERIRKQQQSMRHIELQTETEDLPDEIIPQKFPKHYSLPPFMMDHLKFRYLAAQKHLCNNPFKFPSILICIFTKPTNYKYRMFIRETWGEKSALEQLNIIIIFFTGDTKNIYGASYVNWENAKYGDIVQENFLDSYQNLSYKGIAVLRWINRYCPTAKYMVKIDDNVLVNIYSLLRFIKKIHLSVRSSPMSFFCKPTVWVLASNTSHFIMSQSKHVTHQKTYVTYCFGKVFILPVSAVSKLYNATFYSPFNMVDNVYITGLLARTANISHVDIGHNYSSNLDLLVTGEAIFGYLEGDNQTVKGSQIVEKINKFEAAIL